VAAAAAAAVVVVVVNPPLTCDVVMTSSPLASSCSFFPSSILPNRDLKESSSSINDAFSFKISVVYKEEEGRREGGREGGRIVWWVID